MPRNAYIPPSTDAHIIFQRDTITRDGYGAEEHNWVEYAQRDAAIKYGGYIKEVVTSGKEAAHSKVTFICRYVPTLTEKDRIVYDGYFFDIAGVTPLGRKHYVEIETTYIR